MSTPFILAGVMGWPVDHSRSPILHNHWIQQYGLHGAYGRFPVRPERLETALRGLSALGLAGCNLTIPHKVAALALVDWVHPVAQRIGAINTVVVQPDGALHGYNHDAYGFVQSVHAACPDWQPAAGPAVVLGAGGAARAICVALLDAGVPSLRLCNRTRATAEALAAACGPAVEVVDWAEREGALQGAALLVNTTQLGMHGQPPLALGLEALPVAAIVADIVYVPLQTALLRTAQTRGHRTVQGLGMLVHQARPAFASWYGVLPEPGPALEQALLATFAPSDL